MADLTPRPAQTLDEATANLNFEIPLRGGDGRYVDLSSARGDKTRQRLQRRLRRKQGGTFIHAVFASHRGTGKSTELFRLQRDLSDRYRSLYLEANVEMDPNEIEMEDLLLALAQQIVVKMSEWGHPLPDPLLREVLGWFAETVKSTEVGQTYSAEVTSTAGVGYEVPGLISLTTKLKSLLRVDSKHKTEVKEKLRQFPGALTASINKLLEAARDLLKEREGKELLIVIDNLDRYPPAVVDKLLLQQGDRFKNLHCDIVVTPPISLLYRPERGKLEDYFKIEIMCSVRLRDQGDAYDTTHDPGAELLLSALNRRIDLQRLIPDPAAQKRLLVASGGSIRQLIELTADAALNADEQILLSDVESAVQNKRSRMRDTINASGWAPTLIKIATNKQINEDEACLSVLYHRLAFKYNNVFWYDIHPLVSEIPEIKHAITGIVAT